MTQSFKTIHTFYGLTKMAQAEAAGLPIRLTHMAVGDGNGNSVAPSESQTTLIRERFRATVNRVYQNPLLPTQFTAELVIPASAGGFTLREIGVFDADGALFVVGNLPDTYKPTPADGAFADTVVRVEFLVSNASVVTLQIDPNVAVVTQTWISNNVTAGRMFPGGHTGQILKKKSNKDGDTEWDDINLTGIEIYVDMIEEIQSLAANQLQIDLVKTTTRGLAIYIDTDGNTGGERLRKDQWAADPIIPTRLKLAQSYPAATKIILVQNEPAGRSPMPLLQGRNLSDLPDLPLARRNLGVYSVAEVDVRCRAPGDVFYTAAITPPGRSMKANGAAVSRIAYAGLFATIGTRFGNGDGFNTFNLPDLRGEVIRGWDDMRGVDPGREFGSIQFSQNLSHGHGAKSAASGEHGHANTVSNAGNHAHTSTSEMSGNHQHSGVISTVAEHTHADGMFNRLGCAPYGGSLTGSDYDGGGREMAVGAGDSQPMLEAGGHSHYLNIDDGGSHSHSINVQNAGSHAHEVTINSAGSHEHAISIELSGGNEARMRNIALLACIAY